MEVGVQAIAKVAKRHPQTDYDGLGMLLQLKWQYLQRNLPVVSAPMEPIDTALKEAFFTALFWGEDVEDGLRYVLRYGVKFSGLGIPAPRRKAARVYATSEARYEALVESLLNGSDLNYIGHSFCVKN